MKMIKEWQSIFTIAELCSIFNIPRATYYRWKKQEKTVTNHEEKTVIEICQHHKYRYGYRRVTACLRDQFNIVMNHKKVLRIMRKYNVLSQVRKKKKIFVLGHEPVVAKNRIQRRFKATKPNEKWFTDITYLMFGNKTLYFTFGSRKGVYIKDNFKHMPKKKALSQACLVQETAMIIPSQNPFILI
nr:IS3 family transposase [Bacillus cereus]